MTAADERGDPELHGEPDGPRPIPAEKVPPDGVPTEDAEEVSDGTLIRDRGPASLPAIPDVTLTREIGRGGMGVVYSGRQSYLDRTVAVKMLSTQGQGADFAARFQREAKILAGLTHPNIVACYSAGVTESDGCYIVMEFIDGPNLAEWIQANGPLSVEDSLALCRDVAEALAHAHESSIIHRDVKPANILLKPRTQVGENATFPFTAKLADLGLARPVAQDATLMNLTLQGAVMGSPPTMAPEQFDAPDLVDFRTDIYGLGCVLFHCLTGEGAFPVGTLTDTITRKVAGPAPDPRDKRADIPQRVGSLVSRLLARKREDRPESYEEVIALLSAPATGATSSADPGAAGGPRLAWTLVVGAAVLLGGGAWWALRSPTPKEASPAAPVQPSDGALLVATSEVEPAGPDVAPAELREESDIQPSLVAGSAEEVPPLAAPTAISTDASSVDEAAAESAPDLAAEATATPPEPQGSTTAPEPVRADVPSLPAPPPVGERRPLFQSSQDLGADPIPDWEVEPPASRAAWSQLTDSANAAQVFSPDERTAAVRPLFSGAWRLALSIEIVRPNRAPTELARAVLGFPNGGALAFEQRVVEDRVEFRASATSSRDGAPELLEDLALAPLPADAYRQASPVMLEVAWTGAALELSWRPGGAPEERRRVTLDPAAHGWAGAPSSLRLEVDRGAALFRDLVIEGLPEDD